MMMIPKHVGIKIEINFYSSLILSVVFGLNLVMKSETIVMWQQTRN